MLTEQTREAALGCTIRWRFSFSLSVCVCGCLEVSRENNGIGSGAAPPAVACE